MSREEDASGDLKGEISRETIDKNKTIEEIVESRLQNSLAP